MDPRITDMELDRDVRAAAQADRPDGWVQLAKYFLGELELNEKEALERWFAADPRRHRAIAQVRAAWEAGSELREPAGADKAWEMVQERTGIGSRLDERVVSRSAGVATKPRKTGRFTFWPLRQGVRSAAAAIIVSAIVTVIAWKVGMHHADSSFAELREAHSTYSTANGQRSTITLPDSTTVALNVGSQLEVPLGYMAGNRTVRLVGEALFTVRHHDGAPFTVLAGTTSARVLGTSFVVRHYTTDTATMVAVANGKVAVGATMVTARQLVEVTGSHVRQMPVSDASPFSFATGLLTLPGLSLSDAIRELDRWYDVDIRLGDPRLANRHISGEFAAGSLADLATILELTFDFHTVRNGRVLTLYPGQ